MRAQTMSNERQKIILKDVGNESHSEDIHSLED